jgi:sigma-B regulation protein RsbU (phosphoserine phosphatase)
VIADVSGHGVPAAFGTAVLKVLLGGWARRPKDLEDTVNQLNSELKGIFERHQYLTLFLGRIHPKTMKLEYVLAGHPPPILIQKSTSRMRALSTTGFLVGFDSEATFKKRSVNLHPGDRLLCYTDGLIEIRNPELKAYRLSRLRESLRKHHREPLKKLPNLLIRDAKDFRGKESFDDDLSILVMEISSPGRKHIKKER